MNKKEMTLKKLNTLMNNIEGRNDLIFDNIADYIQRDLDALIELSLRGSGRTTKMYKEIINAITDNLVDGKKFLIEVEFNSPMEANHGFEDFLRLYVDCFGGSENGLWESRSRGKVVFSRGSILSFKSVHYYDYRGERYKGMHFDKEYVFTDHAVPFIPPHRHMCPSSYWGRRA